ncbi:MAG TPA: tetratricopeptide repeat protein [Pirellulaceae bacterium]|nr:tetratricopeptide repeat protein [Pirellulaceae bacterium]
MIADPHAADPPVGLKRKLMALPFVMVGGWQSWWHSRRWRRFLEGLPAILFAGLVLVPSMSSRFMNSNRLTDRYKVAVNDAIARDDPVTADVYMRKLLRLEAMDPKIRYAMAYVAGHQGDVRRESRLLTELASSEHGHPRAHLWMAKQIAAGKTTWTDEETDKLVGHLQAAIHSPSPPAEAHVMLGQVYLRREDYPAALVHLEAALPQRPELHLTIGQVYLILDDAQRAHGELQRAARHFEQRVETDVNDVDAIVSWALACRLQEEVSEAQAILLQGLEHQPNDPRLRRFLASNYVDESDQLMQSPLQHFAQRLQLLEKALQYAPNYPPALSRLATFFALKGDLGEQARMKLKETLAAGKATATVHLILGTQSVAKGDMKAAALHFEQAHELNPKMPVLLNNFAWLLASQDEPELDRALELVNRALKIQPAEPRIRETRGQIYAKQGHWRKALSDLEFALPTMVGNRELHQTLATVYHNLGDAELAVEHERRANGDAVQR